VHYWSHGAIGQFIVKAPMVLGHESAGIVHSVGSGVKDLKVGDNVALEPGVPCRRCVRCKEGKYNLCFDMRFAATPPHDGTLAKYYSVPEDFCYKLPENVSLEEGKSITTHDFNLGDTNVMTRNHANNHHSHQAR